MKAIEIGTGVSLRSKLRFLTAATVLSLCVLFAVLLSNERNQLLSDREEKVHNLVEVVHSTISHFEQEAKEGKISVEEAKKKAIEATRSMRYDNSNYFWINDLDAVIVMHPIKPELDGKNLSEFKDKNGKRIFFEFSAVAKARGAGFVEYVWPKAGFKEEVPKISYVKKFEPWGWVIGTGIYIDDVDELFLKNALGFLAWGLLIGGAIALSLALVGRNVLRTLGGDPLAALAATQRIAAGDLSADINCQTGDGNSVMAGMQAMQQTLRAMIEDIVSGAEQLSSASLQLLQASEEVAKRSDQQSESAASMAAAVEKMTFSITHVEENAHNAHAISVQSGDQANDGEKIIRSAVLEMNKIADAVHSSSTVIEDLEVKSSQITSIVNTIREIADQTNLLALNAAIEAARAGEQGRGFAVVADEVRKLAERTSRSTSEIGEMVDKIQSGTRNAVASMQTGVTQAETGVALADQAGTSIGEIRNGALRLVQMVTSISDSIREQGTVSSDVARSVEHIARVSEENASAVQSSTKAARHLQQLSTTLRNAVGRFKLH